VFSIEGLLEIICLFFEADFFDFVLELLRTLLRGDALTASSICFLGLVITLGF
jgi:hypothetical protein